MISPEFQRRRQKAVVMAALSLLQLLLFFIQIWLFVMLLEEVPTGRAPMAVPVAVASLVILGVNVWMLRGIIALAKPSS